jgi:ribonuclease HI
MGWVKLSVDGSYKSKNGTAGCCMILPDADRQIIFSVCQFLPICVEAIEAELCAWREGLELALVRSDLPIIVESDCSQVVAAAQEKTGDPSPYLNIISDIKLLASQSRVCNFVKVDVRKFGIATAPQTLREQNVEDVIIQDIERKLVVAPIY